MSVAEQFETILLGPWVKRAPLPVQRRVTFAALSYCIASLLCLVLGIEQIISGYMLIGSIDCSFAIILAIGVWALRQEKFADTTLLLSVILFLLFLIFLALKQPQRYSGMTLWFMVYPLCSIFLVGVKRGIILSAVTLLVLIAYFSDTVSLFLYGETQEFRYAIRFILTYLAIGLFSYVFESQGHKYEDKIFKLNDVLLAQVADQSNKLETVKDVAIQHEYKSEMAQIASTTLHNVKNFLNSISVSSQKVARLYEGQGVTGLKKATTLLETNLDSLEHFILEDPKGKKLMKYFVKLNGLLEAEITESKKHLERISNVLDIIQRTVAAQQKYSRHDIEDEIQLNELLDDALTMMANAVNAQRIEIDNQLSHVPTVVFDRAKLMHIFVNLIKNASEAMKESETRKLTIRASTTDDSVEVRLQDTGEGIAPDQIGNLFTHGFTTKQDGHGFGLHSCKVYMEEYGGSIHVESEGKGSGACFVIRFSRKTKQQISSNHKTERTAVGSFAAKKQ